jgi:hypothetical protein
MWLNSEVADIFTAPGRSRAEACVKRGDVTLSIGEQDSSRIERSWNFVSMKETGGINQLHGSPQMITYLLSSMSETSLSKTSWKKLNNPSSDGNWEDMAALSPLNTTRMRILDVFTLQGYPYLQTRFGLLMKSNLILEGREEINNLMRTNKLAKLQLAILMMTPKLILTDSLHKEYWVHDAKIRSAGRLFKIDGLLTCGSVFNSDTVKVVL